MLMRRDSLSDFHLQFWHVTYLEMILQADFEQFGSINLGNIIRSKRFLIDLAKWAYLVVGHNQNITLSGKHSRQSHNKK